MTTERAPAADENLQEMVLSLQDKMVHKRLDFHGFCSQHGARSGIAEALVREGLHRICLRVGKPDWIDVQAKPDQGSLDWGKKHFLDDMAKSASDSPDPRPGT